MTSGEWVGRVDAWIVPSPPAGCGARRVKENWQWHNQPPSGAYTNVRSVLSGRGQSGGVQERVLVRRAVRSGSAPGDVPTSAAMADVLSKVRQVAPTPATVLLLGETGVGKQHVAHLIHAASPRRDHPLIHVNCGAIPEALIESELFGHERGAFTNAVMRQIGRFEAAHRSTLFLDEIGELPPEMQVKLLRVLEDRTVERLGGGRPVSVDIRIIAATNRDLEQAVISKTFRADLYYRINVFPLTIPPLRDRLADLEALIWTFVDDLSPGMGRHIEAIDAESLAALGRHQWPGNVRELRNLVERALILARGPILEIPAPGVRPVLTRLD